MNPIDLLSAFNNKPTFLDFIWTSFMAGTVGALVAPGATGKSFWALQAGMSVACDVLGGDVVGLKPRQPGRVVYFAGEDPPPILVNRVHAIGQHLDSNARHSISQNLILNSVMGLMLNIKDPTHVGNIKRASHGARLIVFDTLSRIHQLDENSNDQMAFVISVLEHIAVETGAAVLFLHHVSKGSARGGEGDQQQASRGASALIDNSRWAGFVAGMSDQEASVLSDESFSGRPVGVERRRKFVRFGECKNNYGEALPDVWFKRGRGGVLVPANLVEASGKKKGSPRECA